MLWGANYCADCLPANGCWLIWDKREGSRPNHQADCEMAWSNLPGVPRLYSHLWIGLCRRGEENLSRGDRKLHRWVECKELARSHHQWRDLRR